MTQFIKPHDAVAMLPTADTVCIAWRLYPDYDIASQHIETAIVREYVARRGAFAVADPDLRSKGYTMLINLAWGNVYVQAVQPAQEVQA